MKRSIRTILIVLLGTIAAIILVSSGFWLAYGGEWRDYLKIGLIPFAILVPSAVWDYSNAAGILMALCYWLLFLAVVSGAWRLVTFSEVRHRSAAHFGIALSALILYVGCYWLTAQAIAAAITFSLARST